MWDDSNNKIDEVFANLKNIKKFPTICPVCKTSNAHLYLHMYNAANKRGGLWIWCSCCKTYSQGSLIVPNDWENCQVIEEDKLTGGEPIYLEEIKSVLDEHISAYLCKADKRGKDD